VRIKPASVTAQAGLAGALLALGRAEEAEAACREALRLDGDEARAHFVLWDALEAQGRFRELGEAARAVLGRRPDHADAHARLGRALYEEGRWDEARAAYETAVRLNPGATRFREGLARVSAKLK